MLPLRRKDSLAPALILLCAGLVLGTIGLAEAATPFGVGRPDATVGSPGGVGAWILAQQGAFYSRLSAAIRASRESGAAAWSLAGLSLAYGVFHAAGPGHGKAVISAYLFASGETLRRGVLLAFASALAQALTAIGLVAVLALVVGATARQMDQAALVLETGSYALIAAVGALLAVRKGAALRRLVRQGKAGSGHVHGPDCRHIPLPAADVARRGGWQGAAAAVLAVGIRPCTGAIIVLVFALAQGIFLAGVAATFAMALGTAVTVAAIAALATGAKGLAARLAAPGGLGPAIALACLELAAGLAVLALGGTLLLGTLALPGQA
jgi:ABC-type nickel/cobalt efflux system permease component RcnA